MTATAKPAGSQPASQPPGAGAGRVTFVGAGPGDEGLVTLRAAALLADDSLVVGHQDVVDRVRRLIGPDAEVTDSQALAEDPNLERANELKIARPEIEDLLNTGTGVEEREEERMIAATSALARY